MSAALEPSMDARDSARPVAAGCVVHADIASLPADALRLFEEAGRHDFQSSAAWFENLIDTVELSPGRPEFHVWREDGHVLAVLPLLVTPGAGGRAGSDVRALGNYYTTRFAPLLADGCVGGQAQAALRGIVVNLLRREAGVCTLNVGPLEAGSRDEAMLRQALRSAGCAVFELHAFQNWVLPVRTDWAGYLAARDGTLRTTLSRMGRRFAARGGRLELLQGGPGLETAISAYETVYAASWKEPEPHPRFMPGLIRTAAGLGQLRMALAWLHDKPVAAQVWLVAGGRADIYKLAHDEAHKETSPGSLLTSLLMRHVFEIDRVTVVDYLSGDDGYKRLWMSEVRERRTLVGFNLRTPRGLALAAWQSLGGLARPLLHSLRSRRSRRSRAMG